MSLSEKWRTILGYEGRYQISSLGRVKSLSRNQKYRNRIMPERIVTQGTRPNNYNFVTLYMENKRKIKSIHRLVAETFIENPFNKETVNHKDFNRKNNNVLNLEWCTQKENIHHAMKNMIIDYAKGERQHNSKLKNYMVKKIILSDLTGEELAKVYGVSRGTISGIKNRKTWKHII